MSKNTKYKLFFKYMVAFLLVAAVVGSYLYTEQKISFLEKENRSLRSDVSDLREDLNELNSGVLGTATDSSGAAEGLPGPTGPQGPQGEEGPPGEPGSYPEGHWERYCLVEKEVFGQEIKGVVMRKSNGMCEDSWKVIKVWEK